MFTIGRHREKQHAASYLENKADTIVVDRVIDAAHDLIEGLADANTVAPALAEAFLIGGGGAWEQTGSWICKLARKHHSLHQLWLQLATHKSAKIRFRVAAFLNEMPDDIRLQLTAKFLTDPSAKVRSKAAGEIYMRPTPDMLPLLQDRLSQEADAQVSYAIKDALSAFQASAT